MLVNAHLQADGLEAECSVLTRVEGKSALGKHSYEPTICVETHSISPEQKLALSFVGYVLGRLQNKQPMAGKLIGMHGSSHTVKTVYRVEQALSSLSISALVPSPSRA